MTTAAGWYSAPGEPGMLRYWSGDSWTEHRQPMPPVASSLAAPALVSAAPAAATPSLPTTTAVATLPPVEIPATWTDPYASSDQSAAQDPFGTHSPLFAYDTSQQQSGLHAGIGVGGALDLDGIPIGTGSLAQLAQLGQFGQQLAGEARRARADNTIAGRSTALKGAVRGMVLGLIIVVIGIAIVLFFSGQNSIGPGEARAQGTVALHDGFGSSCVPVVDFRVDSNTYRATEGTGGSCQGDPIGMTADVIYSVAEPAQGARYDLGSPVESFDILIPLLGVLIFVGGLVALVLRLVRRGSGFARGADAP